MLQFYLGCVQCLNQGLLKFLPFSVVELASQNRAAFPRKQRLCIRRILSGFTIFLTSNMAAFSELRRVCVAKPGPPQFLEELKKN